MASMWSVRWVSTRQVRPAATACVDVGADLGGALLVLDERGEHVLDVRGVVVVDLGDVWCTTSSRRTSSAPSTAAGLISWRVGPHWNPIRASSRSRRYGVAVSPSQRRVRARCTQAWNDTAGMWWHSSTTTSP